MDEKIKELLGNNLPANVVASAVGVSESYVSQLMSDENFARDVAELRVIATTAHIKRDKNYDSIEDELLEKLQEMLDGGLIFTKASDILRAITVVNGAKRRAAPAELSGGGAARTVVKLQLPANAAFAAKFIVNGSNQVLEIAGRSVATMPAKGVVKRLEDMQKNQVLNKELHKKDQDAAEVAMEGLVRLSELPVAELL